MQTCTQTTQKRSTIGFSRWMMTLVIALFASLNLFGQVNYSRTVLTGVGYTSISGGGVTAVTTAAGLTAGAMSATQDDGAILINLPFTFNYNGSSFTQATMCTNGWVGLGNSTAVSATNSRASGNMWTTTEPFNVIAPWYKDMGANLFDGTTGVGEMRYGTIGTDVFAFEWYQAVGSSFSTTNTNLITFQVKIYGPASSNPGRIQILYGTQAGTLSTAASIGLKDAVGGTGRFINALDGTTSSTTTSSAWPGSGNGYQFDPFPACVAPVDQATGYTAGTTTISSIAASFTAAASTPSGYLVVAYPTGSAVTAPVDGTTYTAGNTLGLGTVVQLSSATSFTYSGLVGGNTFDFYIYSYNNTACTGIKYNATSPLTGTQSTTSPGTVTSVATGLWSAPSTWSTNAVPTATDNVVIADGNTVTIDVAANAYNLTVGQGTGGVLQFEPTTARTLTVVRSVTVATGATVQSAASGTVTTHQLIVGTDLTNNGTINFSTNANTAGAELRFNNATSNTFSGTGSNVLRLLTVNKGSGTITTNSPVLDVTTTFSFGGTTAGSFGVNTTTYNGILKISGSSTWSNALFTTASYSLPSTGGLWLNNANFTMTATTGSPTMSGLLRVTAGTFNVGTASGNSMGGATTSQFIIEGGTLNFASRLNVASSGAIFNMSGGTININTVGNTSTATASFGFTSTTSVFTMSGGTINLVQRSTGATILDWNVATTTPNITGGTLNVGTAATATNFDFRLQGAVPNLVINNTTNNKSVLASAALTIYGSATINTGTTLNANAFNVTFRGAISNSGTVTANAASSVLTFQGSAAQTLGGTITSSQIAGVVVNNAAGVTITPSVQINTTLTVTAGSLSSAGTLTLGNAGTNAFTFSSAVASALSGTVTKNYGTGTNAFTYNGSVAQNTGAELPATVSTLTINNSNAGGVTLNSAVSVATTLTLTAGTLNTSGTNLVTVTATTTGSIARTSGYVNGPLARTLPASLASGSTYLMPIGKSAYQGLSMINPTTSAAGTLVVRAEVFDANPGGTYNGFSGLVNNRYWKVDLSGAGVLTATGTVNLIETGLTFGSSKVGQSVGAAASGTYTNVGGTVVTGTPGNITNVNALASYGTGANSTFFIAGTASAFGAGIYAIGPTANGSTLQPDGITPYNGFYATLTAAFAAINNSSTAAGNIVLELQNDYVSTSETLPITSNYQGTASATLTVRPRSDASAALTISGSNATAVIDLNSAKYNIIDGRKGTSDGRWINVSNTNATGAAIRLINEAQNNTVTYATLSANNTSTGIVVFSTTTGTGGNDNNTISYCNIDGTAAAAASPTTSSINAIYASGTGTGTATTANSGNTITNNNIYNYFHATTASNGINLLAGNTAWTISNNKFYQTATRTQTTATLHTAINISSGGDNFQISGNTIGFADSTGTGTYTLTGAVATTFRAVSLSSLATTTASNVQSNTIAGISLTTTASGSTTSSPMTMIYISSGLATANSNTIGSQSANGSISFSSNSATGGDVFGIYYTTSTSAFTANNNIIGGITAANTNATPAFANIYAINSGTSTTLAFTCQGNTIGGTVANSIQSTSINTGNRVVGINNSANIANITGNTVRNLTNAGGTGTGATASVVGINNSSTASGNVVGNNTITALNNTNTTAVTHVTGVNYTASTSVLTNVMSGNLIYALNNASSAGIINGVTVTGGLSYIRANTIRSISASSGSSVYGIVASAGTPTVERNLIYDLSVNTSSLTAEVRGIALTGGVDTVKNNVVRLGTDMTSGNNMYGIYDLASTANTVVLFNSVYIGGSGVGTPAGRSYAFRSDATTARSYQNNIFVNARSNGAGTGSHYALRGSTGGTSGINYNIYQVTGTGGVFAQFNNVDQANYATWKASAGSDLNSFNNDPKFVDPTNATPNLHINTAVGSVAEGSGLANAGVTDDYDGDVRSSYTPTDIGADAFNGISATPQATVSASPAAGVCPATSHAVTARVTSTAGNDLTSVFLNYSYNGGSITSVRMTSDSGSVNGTARWIGTIPAASSPASAQVAWSVTVTDTVLSIPLTVNGTSYRDQYLDIINVTTSATPATICQGQSVTLAATLPSSFAMGTDNAGTKIQTTGNVFRTGAGNVAVKNQYLILASELTAAGLQAGPILSLGFTQTANTGTPVFNNFRLEMALTSTSVLSSTWTTASFTTVYGGTGTTVNPVIGLNTYTFGTPFNWDGTSNILIQTCGVFAGTSGTSTLATTTTTFIATMGGASGTDCAVNPTGSTVSNARPVITLGVNGFAPYTISWKEGATTLSNTNTANTTPSSSGVNTYTFYMTDAGGCTRPINQNVTVNVLPSDPIAHDTTICGTGVATGARVTSRDGTTTPTFKWYDAATGGNLLQTNTADHYLTPISSTTVFYVSELNVATGCEGPRSMVTATVLAPNVVRVSISPNDTVCLNTALTLTASNIGDGSNNYVYSWSCVTANSATSGLPGTSSFDSVVTVTPTAAGTYKYVVSAVDATLGCATTDTMTVVVNPLPLITSATSTPNTTCAGQPVTLAALSIPAAAGTATIGAGSTTTSTYMAPFYSLWSNKHEQILITAAELTAAGLVQGNITTISFPTTSGTVSNKDYTIKLAHTNAANVSTFVTGGFTTVYTTAAQAQTANTNNTITLSTPFNWNGTSNLVIDLCWGDNTTTATLSSTSPADVTSYTSVRYEYNTVATSGATICSTTGSTTGTSTTRPKILLGGQVGVNLTSSYNWSWTGEQTLSGASVTGNPVTSPTSTYSVTATNPTTGCSSAASSVTVNVNALPSAPVGHDSTHCGLGTSLAYVLPTTGSGSHTYKWYSAATGGTLLQNSTDSFYTTPISATTTFYVSEVNGLGCESSPRVAVTETVVTPDAVTASVSPNDSICFGGSFDLSVAQTGSTNTYTYSWICTSANAATSGLSSSTPGQNLTGITPSAVGTYVYTATAVDAAAGCTNTSSVTVVVSPNPAITSATATPSTICAGTPVTLDALNSTAVPSTATIGTQTTTIGGSDGNPYRSGNGTGNQIRTQLLYTAAELQAAGFAAGSFTSLGFTTTSTTGTLTNFEIKLGLTSATSLTTTFETTPMTTVFTQATFTPVAGLNTHVFSTPFNWDGTSNVLVQVCQTNSVLGTSTVACFTPAVASNTHKAGTTTGCTDATGAAVSAKPIVTIGGYVGTNLTPNYNWTWNPGNLSGATVTVSPATSPTTTYTVTETDPVTGCFSTQNVSVTVNPLPATPSATNSTQCGGHVPTASVSSNSGLPSPQFKWYDAASGGTLLQGPSTATTYGAVISTVGVNNFYVSEYNPATGCEGARVNVQVTVTAPPSISASATLATTCAGQSTTLNATSSNDPNYNYTWQPGGLSGASVAVSPTTTTTYKVYGVDVTSGCSDSATVTVTVNPLPAAPVITRIFPSPTVTLGSSIGLCFGSEIDMSAATSTSGTTTAWTAAGSGANSELPSGNLLFVFFASQNETYTATSTITATGCTSSTNITVLVGAPLVVNVTASPNDTVCSGTSVTLSAAITGGGDNPVYTWYEVGNATPIGSGTSFSLTPAVGSHDYYVNVADDCGNSKNDTVTVLVLALPTVTSTPATALICGTGTVAINASGADTYSWAPAGGLSATTGSSVNASPSASTTYVVTGTQFTGAVGCSSTDTTVITVAPSVIATATANPTAVCAGGTANLNGFATTTGAGSAGIYANIKITEITQFRTGTFPTNPYPAYFESGDQDYVEVSNVSASPVDISGLVFELWTSTTATAPARTLTIPASTILPANTAMTIVLAAGTSQPANYYFICDGGSTSTSGPLSSGSSYGFILKNGSSNVDVVATNTFTFPAAANVSASDWSGTGASSPSGVSGTIRTGATDNNTNADWTAANTSLIQTIGSYNTASGFVPVATGTFTYAWSSNNPAVTFANPNASSTTANNITATTVFTLTATETSGCVATANATVNVSTTPLSVTAAYAPAGTICNGSTVTLTATPAGGTPAYTYVWKDNAMDTVVATTASYAVAVNPALTVYKVIVTDQCGAQASTLVTITVNNPQPAAVAAATRCGQGAVTLAATAGSNQRLNWYAALNGGTSLATGSSFTTNVTATTTYYVQATDTSALVHSVVGLSSNSASFGTYSQSTSTDWPLWFNTTTAGVIDSVVVYPSATGTLTIKLRNQQSTTDILSKDFTITSGQVNNPVTLVLNFPVGVGSYQLTNITTGIGRFSTYTNGSGGGYPFNGTGISIVGSATLSSSTSSNTTTYNGFFNVSFTTGGCTGTRVPVVATVTAPPSVSVSPATVTICAGQNTTLTASSSNDPNYKYTWNNGAGTGAVVSVSPSVSTTYTVTAVDTTAGANAGCNITASAAVTVNPLPGALTVTPSATTICQGASANLSVVAANATGNGTIGTGTSSSVITSPYRGFFGSQKVQMLYTAAELNSFGLAAGSVITSVGFNVTAFTGPYQFNGFNIKMKNTSSTSFGSTFESGATTVFGPVNYTLSGTVPFTTSHTLTTPFTWDGTSNLLVEFCFNNQDAGGTSANSATVSTTTTTGNTAASASERSSDSTCNKVLATASTSRPNLRFAYNNGITYSWSGTGLNTTTGTSVVASPTTTTTYTVTATNLAGCTRSTTATVTVNIVTSSLVSQTNATCPGAVNGSFTVAGSGGVAPYQYSINGGTTYQSSGTFSGKGSGTYVVTTKDANNCVGLSTLSVTLTDNDVTNPIITTCATDQTVTANSNCQYAVPDFTGEVIATDNCAGAVTITQSPVAGTLVGVGTNVITLTATDAAGNTATCTVNLNVNGQTFTVGAAISGPTNACPYMSTIGDTATYTISATSAVSYNWTWPAAVVYVSGQGTNTLRVKYNTTFLSGSIGVTVTGPTCTTPISRSLAITKATPAVPGTISGPTNSCIYIGTSTPVTYSIAPVANAITYRWTLPANTTLVSATPDSTSITITFGASFASGTAAQRTLKVKSISGCGNSVDKTLAIAVTAPATPGPMTGPTNVCQYVGGAGGNAVYSIRKVANASSYNWTVPASATIVSYSGGGNPANDTSIVVSFNNTFVAGSIDSVKVSATSSCGTSANRSLALKPVNPAMPGPITGTTDACPYTGTGIEVVYTIRKVATATSYTWVLPAGVTFGPSDVDNTDTIAYLLYDNTFTGGFMTVRSVSGCGQSTTVRSLTVSLKKPVTPGAIVGPTDACPLMGKDTTVFYTIRKVNYATSYTWVTPVGAQLVSHPGGSGVNDTIIEVKWLNTFNTGFISVVANANCASSGTRSLTIMRKIPGTPAPIAGPTDACPLMGQPETATYTIASVLNATSYNWTVPSGATIVSGQGTTSITVSYDNTFTSGNVAVSAVNNCWASTFRTLAITRKLPAVPASITAGVPTACPNRQVTYTAATALNATGYFWTVPTGATIVSGQGTNSIVVEYPNGAISDTVRVQATNNCSISAQRKLKITLSACPPIIAKVTPELSKTAPVELAPELQVTVMPNPSTHQFTIVVKSNDLTTPIQMQVADMSGRATEIRRGLMAGQTIIVGSSYRQGVYLAEFVQGTNRKTVKLIKLQ